MGCEGGVCCAHHHFFFLLHFYIHVSISFHITFKRLHLCVFSSGQLVRSEEDAKSQKHSRHRHTSVMTVASTTLGSSAYSQKKQAKRHHRRKRSECTAISCVESTVRQEQTGRNDRSLSSDRNEWGEKTEWACRNRRALPPRLRSKGALQTDSTSEEEACREARSWSKEKARRAGRRSRSSQERNGSTGSKGEEEKTEVMVLQSVESDEEKEKQSVVEDAGGLKKRHNSCVSMTSDGHISQREGSQSRDKENSCESHSPENSSSLAEEGEELMTGRYQEKGSGGGDMSVPAPQKQCGMNGGAPPPFYDDSELEVCRLVCSREGSETAQLLIIHQVPNTVYQV